MMLVEFIAFPLQFGYNIFSQNLVWTDLVNLCVRGDYGTRVTS